MTNMFDAVYPDVGTPKNVWRWVEAAQHRLVRAGAHRAMSSVGLLICATAALRGLIVLHDDGDFITATRHLGDLVEHRVQEAPI